MRQCIVVCYLHTFTCVLSMFCHSNTEPPTESLSLTHTHRRTSGCPRWDEKAYRSWRTFFSSSSSPIPVRSTSFELLHSLPLTVYFVVFVIVAVPFCVNFVERLINSNLRVRYYNWHSHAIEWHLSHTQKSSPFESTFCQTSRERTHMSCLTSCHMSLLHFSTGAQNERRETQIRNSFVHELKGMWERERESERVNEKIKHRQDGGGLDFYAD